MKNKKTIYQTKFNSKKIINFFYEKGQNITYLIPYYQREFCWNKDDLEIFLLQIENSIKKNENSYFFGFIIFQDLENNKKNMRIIDGQQRMIVFSLFMICFYFFLKEKNNDKNQSKIENIEKYIFNEKNSLNKLTLKFDIFHKDRQEYTKITKLISKNEEWDKDSIDKWIIKNNKTNKTQIFKRFKFIWDFFKKRLNKDEELEKYFNFFEKIEIYPIDIGESSYNSKIIFESLNSTGKPLNLVQLIKNYIFIGFDEKPSEIIEDIQNWEKNLNLLSKPKISKPFEEFFNVYVHILQNKKIKLTKNKALYWNFRQIFPEFFNKETNQNKEIVQSLSKNISIFCCLFSLKNKKEDFDLKTFYEDNLRKNADILCLISLKAGFFHLKAFGWEFKILLHFFSLLSYQKIIKSKTYIECITALSALELFLRIIKGKIGHLSPIYISFIQKIILEINEKNFSENIKNILLFKTNLKNLDDLFYKEIKNFLRRTLEKENIFFEKYKDDKGLSELIKTNLNNKTSTDFRNLNKSILEFLLAFSEDIEFKKTKFDLEHIRPKSYDKNKKALKVSYELGNLILLEEHINKSVGDLSFFKKTKQYEESKNTDVQNFLNNNGKKQEWNSDSIESRTKEKLSEFTKIIEKLFKKWLKKT